MSKRFTIASGITALFGAASACTSFGIEGENETSSPAVGPEAGLDGSLVSETGEICRNGFSNDPKNCGTCGHDCLGAPCNEGQCGVVDLATGFDFAHHLCANGDELFFSSDHAVHRVSKSGGLAQKMFEGPGLTAGIAVDATAVFSAGDDGVYMVPRDGKAPVKIGKNGMTAVAVESGAVYACLFDNGAKRDVVQLARVKDSAEFKIANVIHCESIAPAGAEIFFGGEDLYRALVNGTTKNPLLHEDPARKIAIDAEWVYSTHFDSVEVLKRSRTTNARSTLATSPQPVRSGDITVDATHVYWTTGRPDGAVYRVPKKGGAVETIAEGLTFPKGIVVDDVAVYWTERGLDGQPGNGLVRKKAK